MEMPCIECFYGDEYDASAHGTGSITRFDCVRGCKPTGPFASSVSSYKAARRVCEFFLAEQEAEEDETAY